MSVAESLSLETPCGSMRSVGASQATYRWRSVGCFESNVSEGVLEESVCGGCGVRYPGPSSGSELGVRSGGGAYLGASGAREL